MIDYVFILHFVSSLEWFQKMPVISPAARQLSCFPNISSNYNFNDSPSLFLFLPTFVCECIHSVRWGHKDFPIRQMLSMFINVWVCCGCYILSWFCNLVISLFDNISQPGIHIHTHKYKCQAKSFQSTRVLWAV